MTIAENFGVEDRGRFYDSVGAMRDVIQNHALQVLGLIGMEPPSGNDPDVDPRQEAGVLQGDAGGRPEALRARPVRRLPRGRGSRPKGSTTETFAAIELQVDNWRWSGVPFFIRAGKYLPAKSSEVTAVFRRPPQLGIGHGKTPEPNQLTFRIEPEPGSRMRMFQKKASAEEFEPADLEVLFEREPGSDPEPYERLLGDALNGVHTLFTRQDAIEETWRVVQPLLDHPGASRTPTSRGPGGRKRPRPGQGRHPLVEALAARQLNEPPPPRRRNS